MLDVNKFIRLFIFACACLVLPACFEAPVSDESNSSSSSTATKSAFLTLVDIEAQRSAADISDDDQPHNFGTKAIDTTTQTVFTLLNTGDVPAKSIIASSLTSPFSYAGGSYPGSGGTCGKLLASQATCTMVLEFKPTSMGDFTATVRIGYNNGKVTRYFQKEVSASAYSVPTISASSPSTSFSSGGGTLTLTGTQFFSGVTVTVGGSICQVNFTNLPTSLTCIIPAYIEGPATITVTNTDGKSASLSAGITYVPPPVISSVSPSVATTSGFTTVTVNGSGFQSGATLLLGGEAVPVTFVSSTQLTFLSPSHASGSLDIVITNPDTQTVTGSSAFTYSTSASESWTSMSMIYPGNGFQYAVWTGSKMYVWYPNSNPYRIYDPVTDSWTSSASSDYTPWSPSIVWTGKKIFSWGGFQSWPTFLNTGRLYDPASDTWSQTTTVNAPDPDYEAISIWTGKYVALYEGPNTHSGLYDPEANTWTQTSTTGEPTATGQWAGTWTGRKILLWGGYLTGVTNTGAQYDIETDTWTPISTTGAPEPRWYHQGSWTGSKFIIYGGDIWGNRWVNTGGVYDPILNSWTTLSTLGAPPGSGKHAQVWTGSNMIVIGGQGSADYINTGGIYDPSQNSWSATTTVNAPSPRGGICSVWTGSQLIYWAGADNVNSLMNTGGIYTPPSNANANTWSVMTTTGAPSVRMFNSSVWTGAQMIVWGGAWSPAKNDGGKYDPVTNSWTSLSSVSLTGRGGHGAIWTGSKMVVWGGYDYLTPATYFNDGGSYDPLTNTWTLVTTSGAPSARQAIQAVWSGSKMLVWAGGGNSGITNTGGAYNPVTNTWSAITTTGAPTPRFTHPSYWTGSKLVTWGGSDGGCLSTGGVYDPSTNSWSTISTLNAPSCRFSFASAWTGSKMFVWGGFVGSLTATYVTNTGALYNPATNSWTAMTTVGAPAERYRVGGIWTGKYFFTVGGAKDTFSPEPGVYLNTGGLYNPDTNQWTNTSTTNAISRRQYTDSMVFTGSKVLIWGGWDYSQLNTGGIYTPP